MSPLRSCAVSEYLHDGMGADEHDLRSLNASLLAVHQSAKGQNSRKAVGTSGIKMMAHALHK